MLLTHGSVAVDIHHGDELHTLAEVEAVELLGEIRFFANGKHCADFPIVNDDAELLAIPGQALLQSMLFDTDLAVEILSVVSERCRRANQVIAHLLSGINATYDDSPERIEQFKLSLGEFTSAFPKPADNCGSCFGRAEAERLNSVHR